MSRLAARDSPPLLSAIDAPRALAGQVPLRSGAIAPARCPPAFGLAARLLLAWPDSRARARRRRRARVARPRPRENSRAKPACSRPDAAGKLLATRRGLSWLSSESPAALDHAWTSLQDVRQPPRSASARTPRRSSSSSRARAEAQRGRGSPPAGASWRGRRARSLQAALSEAELARSPSSLSQRSATVEAAAPAAAVLTVAHSGRRAGRRALVGCRAGRRAGRRRAGLCRAGRRRGHRGRRGRRRAAVAVDPQSARGEARGGARKAREEASRACGPRWWRPSSSATPSAALSARRCAPAASRARRPRSRTRRRTYRPTARRPASARRRWDRRSRARRRARRRRRPACRRSARTRSVLTRPHVTTPGVSSPDVVSPIYANPHPWLPAAPAGAPSAPPAQQHVSLSPADVPTAGWRPERGGGTRGCARPRSARWRRSSRRRSSR